MSNRVETTLRIARGGMDAVEDALAWAVDTYYQRFKPLGAMMVSIEVGQLYRDDDDLHEGGFYEWSAVVSGVVEET